MGIAIQRAKVSQIHEKNTEIEISIDRSIHNSGNTNINIGSNFSGTIDLRQPMKLDAPPKASYTMKEKELHELAITKLNEQGIMQKDEEEAKDMIAQFLAEFNKSHEKEPATKNEVQNVTSNFSNSLKFDLSSMIPQV
jgi:hypothetical protein